LRTIDPCFLSVGSIAVAGNRSGAEPATRVVVEFQKGDFQMRSISATASIVAIAILAGSASSFAQGTGGGASGPSAGAGSAVGTPNAGSAGAGTAAVSGVPSGPANSGGLNNSGNDPSGAGNSAKVALPPSPGTNSAGTANSTGSSVNTGSSMTTGSAGSRAGVGGTAATGPRTSGDAAIDAEDKAIDRKLKSICRGC
jgi:hypothetical protein